MDVAVTGEFPAPVRSCAKVITGEVIARCVDVVRGRPIPEAIAALNRHAYVDDAVIATVPRGRSDQTILVFFPIDWYASCAEADEERKRLGLRPADFDEIVSANEADQAFSDGHPNLTQWMDENKNWNYIAFYRWRGKRSLDAKRRFFRYGKNWWHVGVPT
ncbi:hypothetical protein HY972_03345 [Candidatus Kaiserbacteria bacterium]|nr:hypothetical protein [Candidatus Kaiserbacteria bacterium]